MISIKIATWNINGALSSAKEIDCFIKSNRLDVVLLSEPHMTGDTPLNIPGFITYNTPHPNGRSQGGAAVIIKKNLKHHLRDSFSTPFLQATTVRVQDGHGSLDLSAVYCPPKHSISDIMFSEYFSTLGPRFISGGDWNAKHTYWGSRLTLTRGRSLKKSIDLNGLYPISTGEPTYWPTDPNKIPDLVDFFVTKGISHLYTKVEPSADGSSDHSPVLLTMSTRVIKVNKPESLTNQKTDWNNFRAYLIKHIKLNKPLKTKDDIEDACLHFTNLVQLAAWKSTPEMSTQFPETSQNIPDAIHQKIAEKRRLRAKWQESRITSDKTAFNRASKELKEIIREHENMTFNAHIETLSPLAKDHHSLWKATKAFKRPQQCNPPIRMENSEWARTDEQKAETFAVHLSRIFQPNDGEDSDEQLIDEVLRQPFQMDVPLKPVSPREVSQEIKRLNSKKALGFDLITPKVTYQEY